MNCRSLAYFLVHGEHSMNEYMNAWMNNRNKKMLGWHGYRPKGNGCCGALYLGHGERSDEPLCGTIEIPLADGQNSETAPSPQV